MAKRYEELDFSDDFMFCKILVNNEDICMEMIEMIGEKEDIRNQQSP